MDPIPRLACQQCKQRKIKCDKGAPCSACRNAGLSCHAIQRARLPRGKTAKSRSANTNMETRITRIERLLQEYKKTYAQTPPLQATTQVASHPVSNGSASNETEKAGKMDDFVAPDFWKSLSQEVNGLRETLESVNEDEESPRTDSTPDHDDETWRAGAILFRITQNGHSSSIPGPSPAAQATLLELYHYRVESVYKVFHWPTVLQLFEQNESITQPPVATQALKSSILFMAYCTITDSEALALELGDRLEMLRLYRSAAEDMLARSQLLFSPDLITLQAFVVYLNALRTCSNRATTWTLLAVAVRAATALRLGDEPMTNVSLIDREPRRRLLFAIGILDSHASMDRGTVPILPLSTFQSLPLDVNDRDLASMDKVSAGPSQGFTDMTHTNLVYAAMLCQRRMYEHSLHADSSTWAHWPKMLAALTDFKSHVEKDELRFKDMSGNLVMFHKISGPKIYPSLQLLLRRPPYRPSRNIVPPWDEMDILETATEVLEQHMQPRSAELAPWEWKTWVQWHALAVVLAELIAQPHGLLADRAYTAATRIFAKYTTLIADGDAGQLWKPIARLMHRVQQMRRLPSKEVLPYNVQAISGAPSDIGNTLPQGTTTHFEAYPFPSWDAQPEFTDLFTTGNLQNYERLDNVNSTEDTQWLAWDCFLEDLNFPGA